ncbi:MAG: hypothetical protein IK041_08030 [Bacteroidales bacterium]|nr:hypothetical protein [Bacteroidales bacterium]
MNTKLLYQQPIATVLLLETESVICQSGIRGGEGMDHQAGGDETWS